jgi:hypothetical protein
MSNVAYHCWLLFLARYHAPDPRFAHHHALDVAPHLPERIRQWINHLVLLLLMVIVQCRTHDPRDRRRTKWRTGAASIPVP